MRNKVRVYFHLLSLTLVVLVGGCSSLSETISDVDPTATLVQTNIPNIDPTIAPTDTPTPTTLPPTLVPQPTETPIPTATAEAFDPAPYHEKAPEAVKAVWAGTGMEGLNFDVVKTDDGVVIEMNGAVSHIWNQASQSFEATEAFYQGADVEFEKNNLEQTGIPNWSENPGTVYETKAIKNGVEVPMLAWRQNFGVVQIEKSYYEMFVPSSKDEESDKQPYTMPVPLTATDAQYLNDIALIAIYTHALSDGGIAPSVPSNWKEELYNYFIANGNATFDIHAQMEVNGALVGKPYLEGVNVLAPVTYNIFGVEPYASSPQSIGRDFYYDSLDRGITGSYSFTLDNGRLIINAYDHFDVNGQVKWNRWTGANRLLTAFLLATENQSELKPGLRNTLTADPQLAVLNLYCGNYDNACYEPRFVLGSIKQ